MNEASKISEYKIQYKSEFRFFAPIIVYQWNKKLLFIILQNNTLLMNKFNLQGKRLNT